MPFPTLINTVPPVAFEGDFCDANPRSSVDAGPFGLVSGTNCVIGRFGWVSAPLDGDGFPSVVNMAGTGAPTGILHREQQGLITTFLTESGMIVPPGFAVTLMKSGGFWLRNRGTATTAVTHKVFANNTDGSAATGAAGATISGFTETKWYCHSVAAVGELFKLSATPNG